MNWPTILLWISVFFLIGMISAENEKSDGLICLLAILFILGLIIGKLLAK